MPMIKNVKFQRSILISQKGRIDTPSFFDANDLPKESKVRINEILADVILPKDEDKGENNDESA